MEKSFHILRRIWPSVDQMMHAIHQNGGGAPGVKVTGVKTMSGQSPPLNKHW